MTIEVKEIGKAVDKINKGVDDIQTEQKTLREELDSVKSDVDAVIAQGAKAVAGGGDTIKADEIKTAFGSFLRKGDKQGLQAKAMETGVEAEGGYTVIPYLDDRLIGTIAETNPILRDTRRETIDSNVYQQLFTVSGATSGRVAEKATRNETDTPQHARPEVKLSMQFAYPKVTEELVLSSSFDIVGHVNSEVVTTFDADFESEMLIGDGTAPNQKGILTAADSADADGVRDFGSYQLLDSAAGAGGNFGYDDIVTLIHALPPRYRKKAKLYTSTSGVEYMRKLKDADNMPLWRDADGTVGRPQSIIGYEVVEVPQMPAVASNSKCVMFGDLSQAYAFVSHRSGLQILRDPYTTPGYIKFYTRLLCGSGPMDTRALKVLRAST